MRVLLTGASGFVGRAIVKKLSEKKIEVIKLSRTKPKKGFGGCSDKNQYFVDITKKEDFENLSGLNKIEALIHTAGLAHQFGKVSEENFYKVNVSGTRNVLDLAVKLSVSHFIFISSVSVYGERKKETKGKIEENANCNPTDFYAKSKFEAERICLEVCKQNQINLTILRLATVVGEEDPGNFIRLIRALDGGRFIWVGDGKNQKSLIHREDVGRVCRKVLLNQKENQFGVYNISAGSIEVREIVQVISEVLGRKVLRFKIPPKYLKWFLRCLLKFYKFQKVANLLKTIEKWLAEDTFSADKFKKAFDFEFKLSPAEAIGREVIWYLKQKC